VRHHGTEIHNGPRPLMALLDLDAGLPSWYDRGEVWRSVAAACNAWLAKRGIPMSSGWRSMNPESKEQLKNLEALRKARGEQ
jgi:hypothetical protein